MRISGVGGDFLSGGRKPLASLKSRAAQKKMSSEMRSAENEVKISIIHSLSFIP
jgi:hypothetical protein